MADPEHLVNGLTDFVMAVTPQQERLLNIVGSVYMSGPGGQWPIFNYVQWQCSNAGFDATEIIDSLPSLHLVGQQQYSSVIVSPARPIPLDSDVRLSALGLSQSERTLTLVPTFLLLMRCIGEIARDREPDRFTLEPTTIPLKDIWQWKQIPPPITERLVVQAITREPPTGGAGSWQGPAEPELQIPPNMSRYGEIRSMSEYVAWLNQHFGIPKVIPRRQPSPFDLVSSIDYLDVVWQLRFRTRLVRLRGAERTAQLAFGVGSADEFTSRMSALGELISRFDTKVTKDQLKEEGGNLEGMPKKLRTFLHLELGEDLHPQIDEAAARLNAALALRHGGQHWDAAASAGAAHSSLGLPYPISSYENAWGSVAATVADAFNGLRELLQSDLDAESGTDEG